MGCSNSKNSVKEGENSSPKHNPSTDINEVSATKKQNDTLDHQRSKVLTDIFLDDPILQEPGRRKASQWNDDDISTFYLFGLDPKGSGVIYKIDTKKIEAFVQKPPSSMNSYLHSSALYISESSIFVSGGRNPSKDSTTSETYLYNPITNTSEKLSSMQDSRYQHQSILFKDCVYVFGGRQVKGGKEVTLKSCEKFDLKKKKWEKIEPMNYTRSNPSAIIYDDCIYILGGHSGQKRIKSFESYDPKANSWTISPFSLPKGIENGFIISPLDDALQVFGGQLPHGPSQQNLLLNLREDTYICKRSLSSSEPKPKAFRYRDRIIFLREKGLVEEYDILTDKWEKRESALPDIPDNLENFAVSLMTVKVGGSPKANKGSGLSFIQEKKCYLFGDDVCSFIMEANFTRKYAKEHAIPNSIKLYSKQGAIKLTDGKFFLCGGATSDGAHVSRNVYLYDSVTKKGKKLAKMQTARYNFAICPVQTAVYVIGGQSLGGRILSSCERFILDKKKWEPIASLNQARCETSPFAYKNSLYVIGGLKSERERLTSIEYYNESKNVWELLKTEIKLPLLGFALNSGEKKNSIYLIGGLDEKSMTNGIYDFDLVQGDMWEFGNLKEPKAYLKCYEYERNKACVFGGEQFVVEFLELRDGKSVEDGFGKDLEKELVKMTSKLSNNSKRLLTYSLA